MTGSTRSEAQEEVRLARRGSRALDAQELEVVLLRERLAWVFDRADSEPRVPPWVRVLRVRACFMVAWKAFPEGPTGWEYGPIEVFDPRRAQRRGGDHKTPAHADAAAELIEAVLGEGWSVATQDNLRRQALAEGRPGCGAAIGMSDPMPGFYGGPLIEPGETSRDEAAEVRRPRPPRRRRRAGP